MSTTLQSLGIDRMTPDERRSLVFDIWESLAAEGHSMLTPAQRHELKRRADEDDRDPDGGIPWEEVKASARAGLKR